MEILLSILIVVLTMLVSYINHGVGTGNFWLVVGSSVALFVVVFCSILAGKVLLKPFVDKLNRLIDDTSETVNKIKNNKWLG